MYSAYCCPCHGPAESEICGTHELVFLKTNDLLLCTVGPAGCDDYMPDQLSHRHRVYLVGISKEF